MDKWILAQKVKESEAYEQIVFIEWLKEKKIRHTAIPMSTWTSSFQQMRKNKILGVVEGFPDIVCIVPCLDKEKRLISIELKKKRKYGKKGQEIGNGSRVSDAQKEWIDALNECKSVGAFVCYGSEEAIGIISQVMNENDLL